MLRCSFSTLRNCDRCSQVFRCDSTPRASREIAPPQHLPFYEAVSNFTRPFPAYEAFSRLLSVFYLLCLYLLCLFLLCLYFIIFRGRFPSDEGIHAVPPQASREGVGGGQGVGGYSAVKHIRAHVAPVQPSKEGIERLPHSSARGQRGSFSGLLTYQFKIKELYMSLKLRFRKWEVLAVLRAYRFLEEG